MKTLYGKKINEKDLDDIREEEEGELGAATDDAVAQFDDVALRDEGAVRRHQVRRTVVDVVEDVEQHHLMLPPTSSNRYNRIVAS